MSGGQLLDQIIAQLFQGIQQLQQQMAQMQQTQPMQQQLQQQMTQMQQEMALLQQQQQQTQLQLQQIQLQIQINVVGLSIQEKNDLIRLLNKNKNVEEPWTALANANGATPADFPVSSIDLASKTSLQLQNLLLFYQLQGDGTKTVRLNRLISFLQI